MNSLHTIADLRLRARRRLPRAIFDFLDGGAGDEVALLNNEEAFRRVRLVPKVLRRCVTRDLSTRFLGKEYAAPFGVSPMGLGNLIWPGTDEALMMATAAAGIPYSLSTAGSTSIERLATLAGQYAWFQLYLTEDRTVTEGLMRRAELAGIETLIVTVDAAYPARRYRDRRNAFGQPLLRNPRAFLDFALHPQWSLGTLIAGMPGLVNLDTRIGNMEGGGKAAYVFMASMTRAQLDWEALEYVRKGWAGKLVLKGVMDPEDARRSVDAGVDAVFISNHGGRQLGSAVSTLEVLPTIRAAVGRDYPLLLDSGVRSGEDIVKALVLGANFVLVGRPFLYSAAALGPTVGGARVIDILKAELDDTMAQLACAQIADLTGDRLWSGHQERMPPRPSVAQLGLAERQVGGGR